MTLQEMKDWDAKRKIEDDFIDKVANEIVEVIVKNELTHHQAKCALMTSQDVLGKTKVSF